MIRRGYNPSKLPKNNQQTTNNKQLSGGHVGSKSKVLGLLGAIMSPSRGSWGHLGSKFGDLGGHLGAILEVMARSWRGFGEISGRSWGVLS